MNTILKLDNDAAGIELNEDFSGVLKDHKNGMEWRMMPVCYQENGPLSDDAIWNRQERCYMDRYPSFFKAEAKDGGGLRVTVLDPLRDPRGSFTCRVELEGGWIKFTIEDIEESLPSLIFPPFIESDSLVLPEGIGKWVKQPIPESLFRMPAAGWRMRWFGGLRGDNGWIAIAGKGYGESGLYTSRLAACAGWQKTLGRWSPRRSLRIGFSSGGYVGLAKKFRGWAKDNGLFKSLREKIEEVPSVANLIGGRCVAFFQAYTEHKENCLLGMRPIPPEVEKRDGQTQVLISHRDAAEIIREAKELGMKRGYFNLRGWLDGGYDETHPDVWPAEPALGSEEELAAILAEQDPFVALLHDNYQDTYPRRPDFPDGVMRGQDGRLKPGGTWHGGRCYVMNPREASRYMRRNWEYFKKFNPRGTFLDTIGGAHFQEDWHPDHRLTRTEDYEAKLELLKFHKSKGMITGSEIGSDFCLPWVDFFENRHARAPGVSIPLWPLVYHDATVTLRYRSGTGDFEAADDLEDMLWGYAKMWPAGNLDNWRRRREQFKASLRVDEWHKRIGLDEMTAHKYWDDDGLTEQTEFASGLAVRANFSGEPRTHEGRTVPAGSCAILE